MKFDSNGNYKSTYEVAPFAGAWIEIAISIPAIIFAAVAPFAGAWIEINGYVSLDYDKYGRSLRGSVD